MGLRTAFVGWLMDRFYDYVFGPPPESIPTMSLADVEALCKDTIEEAELINEGLKDTGGPAFTSVDSEMQALSDALTRGTALGKPSDEQRQRQEQVRKAKALFVPAVLELVRIGQLHPNEMIRLDSVNQLSKEARFKATELLSGPFGEKLRRALDAGVDPETILSPIPTMREPAPVGSHNALTRKKIRALRRPRPKDQNPVYVNGARRPYSYTLDSTPAMISERLRRIGQNAERFASPHNELEIAKRERAGVHNSYLAALNSSDKKIQLLSEETALRTLAQQERVALVEQYQEALVKFDIRIAQLSAVGKLPKRDERGRFIKG